MIKKHKNCGRGSKTKKLWQNPEYREYMIKIHQGKKFSKKHKQKIGKSLKGRKNPQRTKEHKQKLREIARTNPNHGMKKKHHTEETKIKIRRSNRGKKRTKEFTEKRKRIQRGKWQNLEYKEKQLKAILKGLMKRPTSFEKKIADLCIENSLPFVYTGDGRFLINFKNPDFVNQKDKIVIEVFYSWFKIRDYGSVENYKEFCRRKYEPLGWKVIFIDETEVDVDNWGKICLNKIENFM